MAKRNLNSNLQEKMLHKIKLSKNIICKLKMQIEYEKNSIRYLFADYYTNKKVLYKSKVKPINFLDLYQIKKMEQRKSILSI